MSTFKKNIFMMLFLITSAQTFCVPNESAEQDMIKKKVQEKVKDYAILKAKSLTSKIFYKHINDVLVDYKARYPLRYKIGMQHIVGRYIFQDINQLYNGQTMLHQAFASKDYDLMKVLLFLGADPLVKNSAGVSVYELASHYKEHKYFTLVSDYQNNAKKKIDLEAQTKAQSYYVWFMHHLIALSGSDKQGIQFIVDSLNDYHKRNYYFTKMFLFAINKKFVDDFLNITDVDTTLLQHCIYENNIDLAQMLLYFGSDAMLKNHAGVSAFELAVQNKQISFIKLFWPYVTHEKLRDQVYPALEAYKFEILEIAQFDAQEHNDSYFVELVAKYFGISCKDQKNTMLQKIVDFWN